MRALESPLWPRAKGGASEGVLVAPAAACLGGALTGRSPGAPGRQPPVWWREIVLGLSVFGVYIVVAAASHHRLAAAREHGHAVLAVEEWLGSDIEAAANAWLAHQSAFWRYLANYEYAFGYVLAAFGVLFWIGFRRPAAFSAARTSFILVNLIGIAAFAVYPVAPPRLLGDPRFVDTVLQGHTVGSWGSGLVDESNQVAAMPSLHVAWLIWVCVALSRVTASRTARVLSTAHVLVVTVVVVVTANHYWLDALAGAGVAWLADRTTREHEARAARTVTDRP